MAWTRIDSPVRDTLLDASIVFSFDRTGFERHARAFDPSETTARLDGRTVAVTGANSGLGLAATKMLVARGARVVMLCRDPERGERALRAVSEGAAREGGGSAELIECDVADFASIDRAVGALRNAQVDAVIHNAGALLSERHFTPQGLEMTLATHVVGPFRMTARLWPHMRRTSAQPARIVWVSSGGMYPRRLDVDALARTTGRFDGVTAYADAKRAQVVLSGELSRRLSSANVTSSAMHPGWASTVGVERSLPRFFRLTGRILRSAEQGADTAVWLATCARLATRSGAFWFDRREVSPYLLPGTRESALERDRLMDALNGWAGVDDRVFDAPARGVE